MITKLVSFSLIVFSLSIHATVTNPHPGGGTVVVMGDSIAFGYGASETKFTPEGCFANNLHLAVQNIAEPGALIEDTLLVVADAKAFKPKLIFVSTGGNDVLADMSGKGYPAATTLRNANVLFDQLLKTGALVVYLSLQPPARGVERLTEITALATRKGVVTVDGMNGLWGNKNLMFDDVHPNDKGYTLMCQRLIAAIKPYFP